jgi:hypothetical protein
MLNHRFLMVTPSANLQTNKSNLQHIGDLFAFPTLLIIPTTLSLCGPGKPAATALTHSMRVLLTCHLLQCHWGSCYLLQTFHCPWGSYQLLQSLRPGKTSGNRFHTPLTSLRPWRTSGNRFHTPLTSMRPWRTSNSRFHTLLMSLRPWRTSGTRFHTLPEGPVNSSSLRGPGEPAATVSTLFLRILLSPLVCAALANQQQRLPHSSWGSC